MCQPKIKNTINQCFHVIYHEKYVHLPALLLKTVHWRAFINHRGAAENRREFKLGKTTISGQRAAAAAAAAPEPITLKLKTT